MHSSARRASSVGLPLEPTRTLSFTTHEGTWLSPDLSPDGRTIVFELLGDLYLVDASGGNAKAIATGMAFDSQPSFSPDGRQIVFLSDRSGSENVWVANADGRHAHAVTTIEDDSIFTSPAWSADARTIYVSRFRTEHNAFELQGIDVATGKATVIVPINGDPSSSTVGAVASRDGRWLYYASQVGPHDADPPGWVIRRRDLHSGTEETLVEPPRSYRPDLVLGTFFRPLPSPDGKKLVYATRYGAQMWLRVLDLQTHEDRWLVRLAQLDELTASAWRDLAPHYAFTPDSRALVVNDGGKLVGSHFPIETSGDSVHGRCAVAPWATECPDHPRGDRARPCAGHPASDAVARRHAARFFGAWQSLCDVSRSGSHAACAHSRSDRRVRAELVARRTFDPVRSLDRARRRPGMARACGRRRAGQVDRRGCVLYEPGRDARRPIDVGDRSSNDVRMHRYMEYGPLRDAELVDSSDRRGSARIVVKGAWVGSAFWSRSDTVALLFDDGLNLVSLADGRRLMLQVTGPGYYFQPGRAPVDDLRLAPTVSGCSRRSRSSSIC